MTTALPNARRAWNRASDFCRDVRNYYERGGQLSASARLNVGLLGALAGSVFAVTSHGSAAKAWASLSGATNGMQTQLDSSPQMGAAQRDNRAKAISSIIGAYNLNHAQITGDAGVHSANADIIVALSQSMANACHSGESLDAEILKKFAAAPAPAVPR